MVGSDVERGQRIAKDRFGNTFLACITQSSSGLASSGAYKTSNSGDWDILLVKFNCSGAREWATYYGGG